MSNTDKTTSSPKNGKKGTNVQSEQDTRALQTKSSSPNLVKAIPSKDQPQEIMENLNLASDHRSNLKKYQAQLLNIICALLILLWTYTSLSKLTALHDFRSQLASQNFTTTTSAILLWMIPITEILAATLLILNKTRKLGFHLSLTLMIFFTGYIALVLAGYYERVPCSCGGVLKSLGWKAHFWFNLFFLFLSGIGSYINFGKNTKQSNHRST